MAWHMMVWSDESRFCIGIHGGRMEIRSRRRQRHVIQFSVERCVVWAVIACVSVGVIRATINVQCYVGEMVVNVTKNERV